MAARSKILQQTISRRTFGRLTAGVLVGAAGQAALSHRYVPNAEAETGWRSASTASADTSNAIREAYRDLLDREADENGLRYYLETGWPIPWIRQHLIQGEEFAKHRRNEPTDDERRDMIRRLYWSVLGRQPDADGWDAWVRRGLNEADIAWEFLTSGENLDLRYGEGRYRGLGNPDGQPTFKFPWRGERDWRKRETATHLLTGGPHGADGRGDPCLACARIDVERRSGLDFGTPGEFDVYAIAPGIVRRAEQDKDVGGLVEIDHAHDWKSQYWHLAAPNTVREGEYVGWGTKIARSSDTGKGTFAKHLHLEIRRTTPASGLRRHWNGLWINGWKVEVRSGDVNYTGRLVHPHPHNDEAVWDSVKAKGNGQKLYSDNVPLLTQRR